MNILKVAYKVPDVSIQFASLYRVGWPELQFGYFLFQSEQAKDLLWSDCSTVKTKVK